MLDWIIRCHMRCYFNVCSKADMSQLNLPHGFSNREPFGIAGVGFAGWMPFCCSTKTTNTEGIDGVLEVSSALRSHQRQNLRVCLGLEKV